jgi:signal transduction histidine kinase
MLHRRHFVTYVALAAIAATWGLMLAFSWSATLGAVAFAPWVALIGFDAGAVVGTGGVALAVTLWLVGAHADHLSFNNGQIAVRSGALVVLALGSALAGRRLRKSEAAQRDIAMLQSALIDSTLDGICLTDASGQILISNKPLRRLTLELGMPHEGTVPERLFAIGDTMVEPERYRARMLELAAAPSDASIDEFEVAATGRVFRGYTAPVPDVEGGLGGRIWTLREVTADRELDRMRDAFVATVSHELRTPLTSISGFLEMMQDEEDRLDDTGRQYLNVIRRSTERLYSLVEDLLLVAQIEAKRVELNLADVDVAELAARAVEAMRPAAGEKGVTLEMVSNHPSTARGDQVRLTQVLDNLVSNAVKFTDRDGVVTVTVNGNGDGVELVVEDTGIGVSSEEQGQVFTRFFRASTATKRAVPGTGLGLAISRALVEQHGGTISFSSREGEGTTVTVRLPAQTDR